MIEVPNTCPTNTASPRPQTQRPKPVWFLAKVLTVMAVSLVVADMVAKLVNQGRIEAHLGFWSICGFGAATVAYALFVVVKLCKM